MPWFRIDDGFSDHPKVRRIPRTRRLAAVGLWSLAGSWSAKHSTDGVIPGYMIEELAGTKALAAALVECGLWHRGDHDCPICPTSEASAFVAHAFTERNPSRAQVERDRRAAADRQAKSRERKQGATGDMEAPPPDDLQEWGDVTSASRRDTSELTRDNDVSHGAVTVTRPDPTRPDPVTTSSSSETADAVPDEQAAETDDQPGREDVEHLCRLLADLMVANECRRPTITKKWRTEARLLIDKDGIDPVLAEHVLRWSQASSFWRSNVQSMPKFREQFDTLRLKRREEHEKTKGRPLVAVNGGTVDEARALDMRRNPHKYR